MIYLLIAIVSMSLIMLALKFFNIKGISIPLAIMTNYALALIITLVSNRDVVTVENIRNIFHNDWWYRGVLAGLLYFASMDIMALSTKRVGVAVTTLSARMSLILPILTGFIFLGDSISVWELTGILLVFVALVLIIWQPRKGTIESTPAPKRKIYSVLMPLAVFLSVGLISVFMKSTQHQISVDGNYEADYPVFEMLIFASAFLGAVIWYAITKGVAAFRLNWKSILGGLCLGTFNYFVTLGIMHGLRHMSTSVFYSVYNISIVIITALAGVLIFKERLDTRKITGMLIAIAAIAVLSFLG